jgi:hypothetical protein
MESFQRSKYIGFILLLFIERPIEGIYTLEINLILMDKNLKYYGLNNEQKIYDTIASI